MDLTRSREAWTVGAWLEYLVADSRSLGSPTSVNSLERALKRRLAPEAGGRPAQQPKDHRQIELGFESS